MPLSRLLAGILAFVLLGLLAWSIFSGLGDLKLRVLLGLGVALGVWYSVLGELPEWIINSSGGSVTDDDDPSNISPRVYVPILFGVMVVAAIVLGTLLLWN